ncbi:flippase [Blautia sp. SG-772]|nr:flippase [Blautia sp. SG-772]
MKIGKNKLVVNTFMLYILTFSNYFFSFITVPYQTRVLGKEVYGNLGFATSFMGYFQLVLDFGFLLSATEEVAKYRNDKKKLEKIFTCVMCCKMILVSVSAIALGVLCVTVERFRLDVLLYILYFMAIAINSFIPDYLYRGLEEMKAITIRTVLIKFFFTVMIFVCLKDKSQYYYVPILTLIGNIGAVLGVFIHIKKKIGLSFCRVKWIEVMDTFKKSSIFFYSRIASTVYSVTNTFILGFVYGNNAGTVGLFSASDKLITTGKQGLTPITDSLYPYMIRKRDFKLVKKMLLIFMPIITVGCIIVAIIANPLCAILFGKEFRSAGTYLRLLLPVVWCSFPSMVFGFPVLSPMGLVKYANLSNVFGAVIQIVQLLIMAWVGEVTVYNICIATCITEIFTLLFRVTIVYKNRKRM